MKKLCILLSVMFFAAFLTACGSADAKPELTGSQPADAAAETPADESAGSSPKYDFNGSVFKFPGGPNETIPVLSAPEEEMNGEVVNDAQIERNRKIEEEYNVRIEYPNISDLASSIIKAVSAGDTICDLYVGPLCDGKGYMSSVFLAGCLRDLREMNELKLDSSWYSQLCNEQFIINGRQFFASGDVAIASYIGPACIYLNLNLADNYSLDTGLIYGQVDDGKWTHDVFYGYHNGLDADLNGDGKIEPKGDFFGVVNESNDLTAAVFLASCGVRMSEMEDGKLTVNLDTDKAVNVIGKMHELFTAFSCENVYLYDNIYKEGRALFAVHYTESTIRRFRDMEDDYVILPMPKWDEQQSGYSCYINPWTSSFFSIPLILENEEMAAVITEALAYESKQILRPAIYEVTLKGKAARNEECQKMLDLVFDTTYLDYNSIFNFGGSLSAARNGIFGKADFASKYASLEPKITADIESFMQNFE